MQNNKLASILLMAIVILLSIISIIQIRTYVDKKREEYQIQLAIDQEKRFKQKVSSQFNNQYAYHQKLFDFVKKMHNYPDPKNLKHRSTYYDQLESSGKNFIVRMFYDYKEFKSWDFLIAKTIVAEVSIENGDVIRIISKY